MQTWEKHSMRILIALGLLALALAALATPGADKQGQARQGESGDAQNPGCSLHIELVDAATGQTLPGVVSLRDESGKRVEVRGLLERGLGVEQDFAIHDWYLLPEPAKVAVPQA